MILQPPINIARRNFDFPSIFLAGTIDMGTSEDWQTKLSEEFSNGNWNVFNPRRSDWDSEWIQEIDNPQFYQQVNWELNAISKSDVVLMYFAPGSQSPISLLELGLCSKDTTIYVVCPEGFWRKGNVDIVCQICNIPMFDSLEEAVIFIKKNH